MRRRLAHIVLPGAGGTEPTPRTPITAGAGADAPTIGCAARLSQAVKCAPAAMNPGRRAGRSTGDLGAKDLSLA